MKVTPSRIVIYRIETRPACKQVESMIKKKSLKYAKAVEKINAMELEIPAICMEADTEERST